MLISHGELLQLVEQQVIVGVTPEMVNAASIDITLGEEILLEQLVEQKAGKGESIYPLVDLSKRERLNMQKLDMGEDGYALEPGQFILAGTRQIFNLPNDISCEYKLKSSMARIGLEHLNAGWCDAGWNGSVLTMELRNASRFHRILLRPGDRIGQMVFFRHEPVSDEASYASRGAYNNDKTVSAAKKGKE